MSKDIDDDTTTLNKMAWKESLRDRWILANRPPSEIRFIYCDVDYWGDDALSWEALRQYRKGHRDSLLLLKGTKLSPEFTSPESERERVKKQRRRIAPKTGGAALKLVSIQVPEETAHYHERLKKELEESGGVSKMRVSEYQSLTKNSDNEAEIHDLRAIKFDIAFEHEPKWDIEICQLDYEYKPAKSERKESLDGFKTAVIFGDPHFAFRKYPDGQLDPIHDPNALNIALELIADLQPHHIISTGDILDAPELSRFEKQPEFQGTMNPTLRAVGEFFLAMRKLVPEDTKIDVLQGNHDRRLHKSIVSNFSEAYGWKIDGDETNYPALSVPSLVNFRKLNIEYHSGYPANRLFLNSELQVKHGNVVKSKDSTAKAVTGDERISTIYGHIHRIEQHGRTMQTADGPKRIHAFSSGCLCRIDGAVPSTHSSTDEFGKPLVNYENWEQGLLVVHYHEDGRYRVEPISIDLNGQAIYNGKVYGV